MYLNLNFLSSVHGPGAGITSLRSTPAAAAATLSCVYGPSTQYECFKRSVPSSCSMMAGSTVSCSDLYSVHVARSVRVQSFGVLNTRHAPLAPVESKYVPSDTPAQKL